MSAPSRETRPLLKHDQCKALRFQGFLDYLVIYSLVKPLQEGGERRDGQAKSKIHGGLYSGDPEGIAQLWCLGVSTITFSLRHSFFCLQRHRGHTIPLCENSSSE